jgi:hypothetical protein
MGDARVQVTEPEPAGDEGGKGRLRRGTCRYGVAVRTMGIGGALVLRPSMVPQSEGAVPAAYGQSAHLDQRTAEGAHDFVPPQVTADVRGRAASMPLAPFQVASRFGCV